MKHIDLFAGTGAFTEVLKKYKSKCVFSNDFIESSKNIYTINHPECNFVLKDILDVQPDEIPNFDLLTGGFPCQPFSIAGQRKGFEDTRSNVFWKIMEILSFHKPRYFILENVKNLTSHDKGNTFKTILSNLESIGYKIKYKVLDTSKITGVPQHRERIYIVGFLNESDFDKFNFNFEEKKLLPLSDFFEENVQDKYYYTPKSKIYPMLLENITKQDTIYQYRRVYVRENKSLVCPTMTANMGSGGHNVPIILDKTNKIRKLTPRECFNLQGFPNDFILPKLSDNKLYSLAGNAVSPPVVELIIKALIEKYDQ